jgi:transposase-like protein
MAPINDAIEEIESLEPGEKWSYRKIAKKHGVGHETLRRQHQGISLSVQEFGLQHQKLTQQQELELVKYIEDLTARYLQPTREMVQNFASSIAKQTMSQSWVTQFINRNRMAIEAHWATGMDRECHQADSEDKYQLFFQLLVEKIKEYNIEP